jgi:2-dehydro-3-deoxy-D-gluconate 5-dehydrogenase
LSLIVLKRRRIKWLPDDFNVRPARHTEEVANGRAAPAAPWGAITDFAGIAVFLSSVASDFVTGTTILVDGDFSVTG